MSDRPRLDSRAKSHLSYFAFASHRFSGLLLACFLPLHFLMLSQSLRGAQGFEQSLALTDLWVFKFGEWALVILLAVHLAGGTRLLMIEFGPWKGLRKGWIQLSILFAIACGLLFLYFANGLG
jgi:fumarate reductase subunit D